MPMVYSRVYRREGTLLGDGYGPKRYRSSVGHDFNYKAGEKAIYNLLNLPMPLTNRHFYLA